MKKYSDFPHTNGDSDLFTASAKDATSRTLKDGTGLRASWLNDIWGFFQSILKQTSTLPNDTEETADASQIQEALSSIAVPSNRLFNAKLERTYRDLHEDLGYGCEGFIADGWYMDLSNNCKITYVNDYNNRLRIEFETSDGNPAELKLYNKINTDIEHMGGLPEFKTYVTGSAKIERYDDHTGDLDLFVSYSVDDRLKVNTSKVNSITAKLSNKSDIGVITKSMYVEYKESAFPDHLELNLNPVININVRKQNTFTIIIHEAGLYTDVRLPSSINSISNRAIDLIERYLNKDKHGILTTVKNFMCTGTVRFVSAGEYSIKFFVSAQVAPYDSCTFSDASLSIPAFYGVYKAKVYISNSTYTFNAAPTKVFGNVVNGYANFIYNAVFTAPAGVISAGETLNVELEQATITATP